MSLDSLPRETLIYEIFPKMSIDELLATRKTSHRLRELVTDVVKERIEKGELEKQHWGPETMYNFAAAHSDLQSSVIIDLLNRLHRKVDLLGYYLKDPKHLNDPYLWNYLASNPNVYPEDMEKYPRLFPSNLFDRNPNITPEYVASHPNINFDYWMLADYNNDNFPPSYFIDIISQPRKRRERTISGLYRHDRLTYADILNNPKIKWELTTSLYNSNFTEEEIQKIMKKYSPDRLQYWRQLYSGNPNLDLSLVEASGETKASVEAQEAEVEEDDEYDPEFIWDWHELNKHPNATLAYIKKHPELNWDPDGLLENPNFSYQEAVKEGLLRDYSNALHFSQFNPTTTLLIEQYPELEWNYQRLAGHKFNKDPNYRKVVYRYIYRLLPEQVTVKLDDTKITASKEFIYGLLAAVKVLKLGYDVKYIANDGKEIPLKLEDYRMFTIGDAHQPYLLSMREWPFHFTTLEFLSGVKTAYDNNEIPFDISFYYDKKNNYAKVQIT